MHPISVLELAKNEVDGGEFVTYMKEKESFRNFFNAQSECFACAIRACVGAWIAWVRGCYTEH